MIFTECPTCDEPQSFAWEAGDPTGYFPSKCPKCGKVMWIEATSMGGQTLSHDDFKKQIMQPGDEGKVEKAAQHAPIHSTVVYS